LNGLDFLRLVLPTSGWYVGWAKKTVNGQVSKPQRFFTKIEALHAWCVLLDQNGYDVYYACASFAQNKRRTHDNVLSIADLWADIDTRLSKPHAPYADPEEAAAAVVAFCRLENLPFPLWVSSGGGLHIHWPLAKALLLAEWHSYALGLKCAAKVFGLQIDPARTADVSSILRVPGTHHQRTGRVVQANPSTERFDPARFEHLKRHINEQDRSRRVDGIRPARVESPIAAAIADGIGFDPSDPNLIRRGCRQIGAFAENPGQFGEPFNRLVAGVAKNCEPGAREIYLSWLDPEWRSVGADYFERWSVGPPWCATFESTNPGGCEGCSIKGEGKTPLWWGRQAERKVERLANTRGSIEHHASTPRATAPLDSQTDSQQGTAFNGFPILSAEWGLDPSNRLCQVTEDKKNQEPIFIKVSEHPIYVSGVHASEVLEKTSYTFKHWLPNEGWTEINVPGSSMGNGRGIPELMDSGVIIHDPKLFTKYMNEQIGEFNRVPGQRRSIKYEQCGWKGRDYLFGTVLYKADGTVLKVITNDEVASRAKLGLGAVAGGDPRIWVSINNQLFPLDHYCAWLNIGFGFGSIFMPWHSRTEGGLLVSNFTPESGKGKTRIIQAAAAIWGHWNALSIKDYDTPASQGLILAALCNIPGFVDELAHFARHPQYGILHLREFLDKFAAGHDKHRALQHGMGIRHQLGFWAMILLTTSNQSIQDLVDVQGGLVGNAPGMRIAEFDATPPRAFDTQLGDQLEPHLWLNAGHAGDRFLRHILRPDIQQAAHKYLNDYTKSLWEAHRLSSEQRFRVRGMTCAALGLMLAKEVGLVPAALDIGAVISWGMDQLRTRMPAPSINPHLDMATDVLARFLHANILNTLRVQHPYRAHVQQMVLGQKPQKLVVRHESESKRVYAAQKEFRTFVINNGFPYTAIVKELMQQRILRNDKRMLTLGAGTEYASVQIPCVEFDGEHPIFGSLLQEVSSDRTNAVGQV
jgi:Domain of unknown function (DUF927)